MDFDALPRVQVKMVPAPGEGRVENQETTEEVQVIYQPAVEEPSGTSMWGLGVIVIIVALMGWVIWKDRKAKKSWLWILVLASWFFTASAYANTPTGFLFSPQNGDRASGYAESSFNRLMIRGGIVLDDPIKEGLFFPDKNPTAARVVFNYHTGTPTAVEADIDDFVVEHDRIHFSFPITIPAVHPFSTSNNSGFSVQAEIVLDGTVYEVPMEDGSGNHGLLRVDSIPPAIVVNFVSPPGVPTNQPVEVDVGCIDGGSGCEQTNLDLSVKGNFCDDPDKCDDQAIRTIRVCDRVDNCQEQEISVDFYDPIPPIFRDIIFGDQAHEGFRFTRNEPGREWHIDGQNFTNIAAFGDDVLDDYTLKFYIDDERGLLRPHIVKDGNVVFPDDIGDTADPLNPNPEDLTDPSVDISQYVSQGLACPSEGDHLVWCKSDGSGEVRNCCLLNVDETLSDAFEAHLCAGDGDDMVAIGDRCMYSPQNCHNADGEKGVYHQSGLCILSWCPFGFSAGTAQKRQEPNRCYLQDNAVWTQACGACHTGRKTCRTSCELQNGIPLQNHYCDVTTRPDDIQSCS